MSLATLPSNLLTAVTFLAMISILVAAHEYGHYYFARLFGMGVEEFAIGMGKKLKIWGTKTYDIPVPESYVHNPEAVSQGAAFEGGNKQVEGELIATPKGPVLREKTEFTVRMLPIGGFVRIKGMIPQDDGSEVRIPGGFYSFAPWKRLIVLVAGPAASVISGVVILIAVFMIFGQAKFSNEPIVGVLDPTGPAAVAGLNRGDRVTAINGKPISSFYEFVKVVNDGTGQRLKLDVMRGSDHVTVMVVPESTTSGVFLPDLTIDPTPIKHGRIGINPTRSNVLLGVGEATREAINAPIEAVAGLLRIIKQPSKLKDEAGGAITMVAATQAATEEGLGPTIWLACMLSISVGIFNLLPIPPLDGGQMVMAFAELLRGGRRLSIQVQQALMNAGVLIVLTLAVVVLFIDIQRFSGGSSAKASKQASAPASKPAK
jgi:regulator of sigma E protease